MEFWSDVLSCVNTEKCKMNNNFSKKKMANPNGILTYNLKKGYWKDLTPDKCQILYVGTRAKFCKGGVSVL